MGRKANTKKKPSGSSNSSTEKLISVDPAMVRFQHSRIRPFFSGCGRSVTGTLDSIRRKELSPSDLPPIQVIVGPTETPKDGAETSTWYFSLNNRRLWVLKRCREEGLLENNVIPVRVREPKSKSEAARYSLANCALEASIVKEKNEASKTKRLPATKGKDLQKDEIGLSTEHVDPRRDSSSGGSSSSEGEDDSNRCRNRFSLLD